MDSVRRLNLSRYLVMVGGATARETSPEDASEHATQTPPATSVEKDGIKVKCSKILVGKGCS